MNGPSQPDFAAALLRPPTWKALVANQQLLCGLLSYRENRGSSPLESVSEISYLIGLV